MNKNMSLENRMKRYEAVSKNYLMRKTPVIMRLDGKAFHSFTRGFSKPFDDILIETMQETMRYLCENIQGCVLGYTQSDEITLVLCDYQKIDTDAWFGYNVQKVVSVAASMAAMKFNQLFSEEVEKTSIDIDFYMAVNQCDNESTEKKELESYKIALERSARNGAIFDARAFNIPIEEVNNCLIWRQQDAIRNSIQSLAQSLYSHKELMGINTKALQDKMLTEKGINWNDLLTEQKWGSCCVKTIIKNPNVDPKDDAYPKPVWQIDNNIPIFTQDRNYVNSRIKFDID